MSVNRRDFCQHVVYIGFGSYLALAAGACRGRSEGDTALALRDGPGYLTAREYQTLAAACERMFPADEDPGAIALGAPSFVERELSSGAFTGWQEFFRESLRDLDSDAVARHQKSFVELDPAEQDALLETWVHGRKPRPTFILRLMHLTLEGVFCDPVHGGNKGGAAWALIGFAPSAPRPGDPHRM